MFSNFVYDERQLPTFLFIEFHCYHIRLSLDCKVQMNNEDSLNTKKR